MKIQLKRSNVLSSGAAKTPTASQLEYGELAVNYNTSDPAIFLKDSNNNIIRISGVGNISDDGLANVPDGTTPPANPEAGNLWYNSDQGRLYIYFTDTDSSQWVDASPDSWDPSSYPDVTNSSAQSNTLDDRYAMINGNNSFTGNLTIPDKILHSGDTNTAIRFPANDTLTVEIAGSERLRIDSSGLVNVTGGVQVTENVTPASGSGVEIFKPSSTVGQIQAYNRSSSAWMDLITKGNTQQFHTNGSERMRIDSSGNVGIGTTPGTVKLKVVQTVGTGNINIADFSTPTAGQHNLIRMITRNGADSGTTSVDLQKVYQGGLNINNNDTHSANYTAFKIGASERLRIDSAGNVGIGLTSVSSSRRVEILQPSSYSAALRIKADGNGNDGDIEWFTGLSQFGLGVTQGTDAIRFRRESAELMRITSSGNIGIGTDSPESSNRYVQIHNGNNASSSYLHLTNTGTGSGSTDGIIVGMGNATDAYFWNYEAGSAIFATNSAERMRIDSTGRVGIGSGSMSSYSSYADNLVVAESGNAGISVSSSDSNSHYSSIYFHGGATRRHYIECQSGANGNFTFQTGGTGPFRFLNSGGELMRIDSSGRLLVGSTSTSNNGRLVVRGSASDATGGGALTIQRGASVSGANQHLGTLSFGEGSANTGEIKAFSGAAWTGSSRPTYLVFETTALNSAGPTERMQIRSNGDVILGPYRAPGAFGTVSQNVPYSIKVAPYGWSNGSEIAAISMGAHGGTGQDDGEIVFKTGSNVHTNANALQERVRILSTGGMTFNGDTAQVNALDDYEEGSCTITLYVTGTSNTTGASNTVAYYTKVGNIVNVTYYSGLLSLTNTGNAEISGLPFVAKNLVQHYPVAVFTHTNCFTTDIQNGYMNVNTTNLYPMQVTSTTPAAWNTSGGARYLMFTITYQTN